MPTRMIRSNTVIISHYITKVTCTRKKHEICTEFTVNILNILHQVFFSLIHMYSRITQKITHTICFYFFVVGNKAITDRQLLALDLPCRVSVHQYFILVNRVPTLHYFNINPPPFKAKGPNLKIIQMKMKVVKNKIWWTSIAI